MSEKRFKLQHINDLTDQEYMRLKKITDNGELITLGEVVDLLNEQQATINKLQDTVYDELDKALKVLEEIYEDYPKNNVHRLYNNLKGLKEMME